MRRLNNKRGFTTNSERGSTLVEFAFVVIVLLLFLFGIIDFGRALYTYHFVANAAREATRYASVRGAACKLPACPASAVDISSYVASITPTGINSADVVVNSVDSFIWPGIGPGSTGNNGGCNNASNANKNPGCLVRVQITYPFRFVLPFMPSNTCSVGQKSGNICITSSSEMVISQ